MTHGPVPWLLETLYPDGIFGAKYSVAVSEVAANLLSRPSESVYAEGNSQGSVGVSSTEVDTKVDYLASISVWPREVLKRGRNLQSGLVQFSQQFTSFSRLMMTVKDHLASRNLVLQISP